MKHTRLRTILGDWMRSATEEERTLLADRAGTSINYLYQLAGVHRENPNVRLALSLVTYANLIRHERIKACAIDPEQCALPRLTVQDLATPTRHC